MQIHNLDVDALPGVGRERQLDLKHVVSVGSVSAQSNYLKAVGQLDVEAARLVGASRPDEAQRHDVGWQDKRI